MNNYIIGRLLQVEINIGYASYGRNKMGNQK